MKKTLYAVMLLFGLGMISVSCSTSPEVQAKKDAKVINRALEKNDANAMRKAERTMKKHLNKYSNNREKYFRYADTYKDNLK
jgi:hypothetical protein